MLFAPSDTLAITVAVDHTRQRPEGYTQVVAGVAPTLRPANRQYPQIAADLGYTPPSFNAFDRVTDVDTPLRSYQDLGGASLNVDWKVGRGRLTSTTALALLELESVERPRLHRPAGDDDLGGAVEAAAVDAGGPLRRRPLAAASNFVAGAFAFHQTLDSDPVVQAGTGLGRGALPAGAERRRGDAGPARRLRLQPVRRRSATSARRVFGQVEWSVTDRLRLLPGLRFNYDQKDVDFDQQVYGGLQTTDPALIALQRSVLAPQAYTADVDDTNLSGQITAAYKRRRTSVNAYATYATGFKSVGLNLNGVPTDALDRPVLSAATVKPEDVRHFEVGVKTEPFRGVTANVTRLRHRHQGLPGAGRQRERRRAARLSRQRREGPRARRRVRRQRAASSRNLSFYGAAAYTDGSYVSFPDAPPPLEETGGPQVKDISGSVLPGISKWAVSFGGEYAHAGDAARPRRRVLRRRSTPATARRSRRAPAASRYLMVDGYSLVNARVGFRWTRRLDAVRLVAQPARQGLLRAAHGGARQHRSLSSGSRAIREPSA